MRFRTALFCGFGLPALFLVIAGAFGQHRPPQESYETRSIQILQPEPPKKNDKTIEQNFPPNGAMETAWKVEWDTSTGYGLYIKSAWFKRGPQYDWLQVLGDARVSEIFVPYHRGSPRFWDVSYDFGLSTMTAADAGPHGKIHTSKSGSNNIPCVVEELKDRGVIWKSSEGVRRGHSLVLWACLDAANYRYIMEYGFQDDGCITFRLGSTGRNYSGSEWDPHLHNAYWRMEVNLGGKDDKGKYHNTAQLMERIEPLGEKVKAQTVHTKFNKGKEGWADWDAKKFTMVRVINTKMKNKRGEYYSYDLMPARMGTSRHFGEDEECSQHDFWVTKANPKELNYQSLPKYCNNENIEDTNIVVWYSAPMHHEPRSEDGMIINDTLVGCTHVGWSTFTLRPSNIFDRTPLFPYKDKPKAKDKK
jgi:primary-amine oxidase